MTVATEIICSRDADEPYVETAAIAAGDRMVIAEDTVALGSGDAITLQITATSHVVPNSDGFGRVGERLISAVEVANTASDTNRGVETLAAPVRFSADRLPEPQLQCEDSALARIQLLGKRFGMLALRLSDLVRPYRGAHHSPTELYESAAPGAKLEDALYALKCAREFGRITDREASIVAGHLHGSARAALAAFHGLHLVHGHAHLNNFIVDVTTGEVTLIDYTLSMDEGEDPDIARNYWRGMMDDATQASDVKRFEARWREAITVYELPHETPQVAVAEWQSAVAKLEPVIMLSAVAPLVKAVPTEKDIDRLVAAKRELICRSPVLRYPRLETA